MLHTLIKGVRSGRVISCSVFLIALLVLPVCALSNSTDSCNDLLGLKFQNILSAQEQQYLGITRKNSFSLKDVQGTLFVIEVFSTYCTSCPRDVPVVNEAYSSVINNPGLKEHVRVFSIAIGNTRTEAEQYKKDHKIHYPVLTDYDFIAHEALGNPRVPYTLILRKTAKGKCVFEYSHQGILSSAYDILNVLKSCTP